MALVRPPCVDHPGILSVCDAVDLDEHSRSIARIYSMTFDKGIWKLQRDSPDFTSLPFRQRFVGTFSDDATRIDGRWELSHDGSSWSMTLN